MSVNTQGSETIYFRPTQVGAMLGTGRDDDFQAIWRGLPIARIAKTGGLSIGGQRWNWRLTLPGRPLTGADHGTGDSFDECEAAFRAAWTRIRPELTEANLT